MGVAHWFLNVSVGVIELLIELQRQETDLHSKASEDLPQVKHIL